MERLKLTDYLTDIEIEDIPKDDSIFETVNWSRGYAIPNDRYWKLWHSDAKQLLKDAGLRPYPFGESFGRPEFWIVEIPVRRKGETRQIADILKEVGIAMLTSGR